MFIMGNAVGPLWRKSLSSVAFSSIRCNLLNQCIGFLKRLRTSVSNEVRIMSHLTTADARSVTMKNCLNIREEFGIWPWTCHRQDLRKQYKLYVKPNIDAWRLPLTAVCNFLHYTRSSRQASPP